ncbi:hypothetical protein [Bacillus sp. OTU530]|uniref:hypothetical protein n=1 Tax=Bacillus sp. OTU530 TaxID=3043862 RepID=UPI00313E96A2
MARKPWKKPEEEILKEYFANEEWEQLLKRLPNKTEKQILMKADRMGLEREDELIEIYYDEEKTAWVESKKSYSSDRIWRTDLIYPCSKGMSFTEVQELFALHVQNVFYDRLVKAEYMKLLQLFNVDRDKELLQFVWDVVLRNFVGKELENHEERLEKVIESIRARKKELKEEAERMNNNV